ncbi:MAG: GNAT family N-acetyltransferase, partial [Bacillota bacterium]
MTTDARSWLIREVTPADAAALAGLLEIFNKATTTAEMAARRVEALKGLETVFLAFEAGVAVGLCSVRIVPNLSDDRPYSEVAELFVLAEQRRKGIARALIERAEALAAARGSTHTFVQTGFKNATAQAFYRSAGYGD